MLCHPLLVHHVSGCEPASADVPWKGARKTSGGQIKVIINSVKDLQRLQNSCSVLVLAVKALSRVTQTTTWLPLFLASLSH